MSEQKAKVCMKCVAPLRDEDVFCPKCGTDRNASTKGEAPDGSMKRKLLFLACFAIIPLSAAFFTDQCGSAEGELRVTRGDNSFVIAGGSCDTLDPTFGVFVNDEQGGVVVIEDAVHGVQVSLVVEACDGSPDECTTIDVPRERCSVFDAAVESAGWRMNRIAVLEGHVELECTLDDGTSVEGRLEYGSCH